MASFIYFYSKFTEDFLLLGAAAIFTLLSVYCYQWVIRKRLLGAARNQVPAGVVRVYLNQLINEAQSVRTQLFGLLGGPNATPEQMMKFQMNMSSNTQNFTGAPSSGSNAGSEIPADLSDRLKALEGQLTQKESMVVNVNIEKMKLLEEIENLKQNQKAVASSGAGDNSDLLKKIKSLEERLDEYALFEDDLANLKRLQQENAQLKKRIADQASAPAAAPESISAAAPAPAPISEEAVPTRPAEAAKKAPTNSSLDQDAINQLLDGITPAPQTPDLSKGEPSAPISNSVDDFEKLVDSVEGSLDKKQAAAPIAPAPAPSAEPVVAAAPVPVAAAPENAPTAAPAANLNTKTDEELLKEFENLLNT